MGHQGHCSAEGRRHGLKCTAVRCAERTRAGKRCKRFLSVFSFHNSYNGPRCFQHRTGDMGKKAPYA